MIFLFKMIRLFSSFDLYFFFKNWIRFFFISFRLICSSYFNNGIKNLLVKFFNSISRFFFSLKIKSFNKFSNLIFIRIFIFLIIINFFSVFSFIFPYTSQVRIMLFFSLRFWFTNIIFRVYNSLKKFLFHFIPEGTPLPLTFLLFLIELVRNIIRPITLIVRLVANILAGHLLMILLSILVFNFNLAFIFYIGLNVVELFVALIQSYIFTTIIVLYYSEV